MADTEHGSDGDDLPDERYAHRARDAALVARIQSGDSGAFGELYDAWFDRVYDLAFRILRDRESAADVAQDTFLSAWKNIERLRDPNAFGGWLLRIARNGAFNRSERDNRQRAVDDTELAVMEAVGAGASNAPDGFRLEDSLGRGVDPARAMEDAELHELVWESARALGPRDAEVLDLQLRHGLTPAEVGEVLGMNRNAANQLVHRVRGRLDGAVRARVLWRGGHPKCEILERLILSAGITTFDADAAKLINRHADQCEQCQNERQLGLEPAAMFAALPLLAAPDLFKAQIASALQGLGVSLGGSAFASSTASLASTAATGAAHGGAGPHGGHVAHLEGGPGTGGTGGTGGSTGGPGGGGTGGAGGGPNGVASPAGAGDPGFGVVSHVKLAPPAEPVAPPAPPGGPDGGSEGGLSKLVLSAIGGGIVGVAVVFLLVAKSCSPDTGTLVAGPTGSIPSDPGSSSTAPGGVPYKGTYQMATLPPQGTDPEVPGTTPEGSAVTTTVPGASSTVTTFSITPSTTIVPGGPDPTDPGGGPTDPPPPPPPTDPPPPVNSTQAPPTVITLPNVPPISANIEFANANGSNVCTFPSAGNCVTGPGSWRLGPGSTAPDGPILRWEVTGGNGNFKVAVHGPHKPSATEVLDPNFSFVNGGGPGDLTSSVRVCPARRTTHTCTVASIVAGQTFTYVLDIVANGTGDVLGSKSVTLTIT